MNKFQIIGIAVAGLFFVFVLAIVITASQNNNQVENETDQTAAVETVEYTDSQKEEIFEDKTSVYFSHRIYTSKSMDSDTVTLSLNDDWIGADYFTTGSKIEKVIAETPFRVMIDMPWINQVDISIEVEGQMYSTSQTRESIEAYTGERIAEYETAGAYMQAVWLNSDAREEFYLNFVE